jgi:membrane-associated protein
MLARARNGRLQAGVTRADELFTRYGYPRAIVLARFIPVVRTVLNPLAGMLAVPARTFTVWQVTGGAVWSVGLTLAGYALGATVPGVDQYLLPVIALIVVISLIPLALELLRGRREARAEDRTSTEDTTP